MPRSPFIPVASPKLARDVPSGPDWQHEIKFDGYRLQIHVDAGGAVQLFGKNGGDLTKRFRVVADAAQRLSVRSAIIDAEVVACDPADQPDFYALHFRRHQRLCAWCFDLLMLNGTDLRDAPLQKRRRRLADLLAGDVLRYSAHFADGDKLFAEAEGRGLEGIVSKRRDAPYVAGERSGWLKIKTAAWRAANRDRYELFEKS